MALTLAQAKVGMANKVDQMVVDEFRRSSLLLDSLIFDDAVSPTGGSTLVYGYQRIVTPSMADFRAINEEYTPNEAVRTQINVNLKVFGGAFEIDRVIAQSAGAIDEVDLQLKQKIKSAVNLFHYIVINGDTAVNAKAFDGLDVILTGSDTEYNTTAIDLSTQAKIVDNGLAFLGKLDDFLALLDGKPSFLMGNSKMINRLKAVARYAGYLTPSEDAFGRPVETYNGIPLLDLEKSLVLVSDGNTPPVYTKELVDTVPIYSVTTGTGENAVTVSGLTDLYAIRIGLDGFHGVSLNGDKLVKTWLPNFEEAGAVKKGEVEMVSAIALKATKSAGVFRKIKVQ